MSSSTPSSHPTSTATTSGGSSSCKDKKDAPRKSGIKTGRIPVAAPAEEEGMFIIRVINTITYRQTKLSVKKEYTLKDVHAAYSPYESHPEYYLWKDMFGKIMDPDKTLVQNGLVGEDEIVEFGGVGKEPCILLIFKDGFENKFPASLNPSHKKGFDGNSGLCRNY